MPVVTMRQLLDSGVHYGHQTRRWNPRTKPFLLAERHGIHIIDLHKSLSHIDRAYDFVKNLVAGGGTILFVGTKKQAQEVIGEQALRVGQPYVNHRWLGGMLTNFQTVSKRLGRLKELQEIDYDDVASSGKTKKELLLLKREYTNLERNLGGIRNLEKLPDALFVVDTNKEHLAVDEARKLRMPVVGILDTNCDPQVIDYPIPGNDDAIRSVALLTRVIARAVGDGAIERNRAALDPESGSSAEPLAEWERELLEETNGKSEEPGEASEEKAFTAAAASESTAAASDPAEPTNSDAQGA